ncbi:family 43 glycosylhydrolase [Pelagicoccus sp. NFK12]|uniref:Family 43 glycosylhydrolase n=1 Tax=Pelagicoccus enzymogenes TaxID=2773457 RepID=A0A927F4F2_9BACT|nr:family 43 glycosylhydrolase [Pelagicoccus enzymogenes]MBD5777952.1 family 43 glycosylhydrolase [Pelagicoccus enzymogenes]
MRATPLLLVLLCLSSLYAKPIPAPELNLDREQRTSLVKSHERAFQALAEKIRDPYITLGPDGMYYLTGTTAGSHWGDTIGIQLWRSKDLVDWDDMGYVWNLYKDGAEQDAWHLNQPVKNPQFKNPYALWAPEIHYKKGTWWIATCLNVSGHGLLRSVSGRPEGPYEAMPRIGEKGIDSHLFEDSDGTTYYLYQANKLARMEPNMGGLAEDFVDLQHDGNHPLGYEGVYMMKLDDKYLFIASGRYGYEPTNSYDLYYAVSKNLYGPYGPRRMALKNAGHGNLFQDKQGRWWSTAFDHEFTDLWSLWLVPIDVEITEEDILISSKDPRFQPSEEDQAFIRQLAVDGVPAQWEGKAPWWLP